jgi:L-aspartate oxidase
MTNHTNLVTFDYLVIGSGLAGLTVALHLAEHGTVAVVSKRDVHESNTKYAQGGVACVLDSEDSFAEHITDTLTAGGTLCNEKVVRTIVEKGPEAIYKLIDQGARFTTRGDMGHNKNKNEFDLGREGGHTKRRVLHAGDITGSEIERALVEKCRTEKNIKILEHHIAVDLITSEHLGWEGDNSTLGAYILEKKQIIKQKIPEKSYKSCNNN